VLHAKSALTTALIVLIAALLIVGVVSHTPLRHAVQVAPMVVVLGLRPSRRAWLRFAAMAMFVFWFSMMVLIWLYLLGIARVVTGHFPPIEIVLTVVIGLTSVAGIVAALRVSEPSGWPLRLTAFVLALGLQFGAALLSVQPMLATR
jgi:hypothetical protein